MKFKIKNSLTHNASHVSRRCGYMPIYDRKSAKESFIKKISSNRYPRFHLYLKEIGEEIIFDLHLDQSATRYEGQTAHNADYDSEEVKTELSRIYSILKEFIR